MSTPITSPMQPTRRRASRRRGLFAVVALVALIVAEVQVSRWQLRRLDGQSKVRLGRIEGVMADLRREKFERMEGPALTPASVVASVPLDAESTAEVRRQRNLTDRALQAVLRVHRNYSLTLASQYLLGRAEPSGSRAPDFRINSRGELEDGFGDLFGLEPEAVARLERVSMEIVAELDQAVLARTTATALEGGGMSFQQKALPETVVAGFRDRYLTAFREALGDANYEVWSAFVDSEAKRQGAASLFYSFGASEQELLVKRAEGSTAENHAFQAQRSVFDANGRKTSGLSMGLVDRNDVDEFLGPLVRLLPPGF